MANQSDPITLELLRNALDALVDEMALTLVRTAYSSNLKNAMDLSAAVCDADGQLIAQGLTLPLHLGSVPEFTRVVIAKFDGLMRDGDIYITNDPYEGGSHLPDIYLCKPVFFEDDVNAPSTEPIAFVVCIAHHTDIGGKTPGGNGCDATELYQEGLCIPLLKTVRWRGSESDHFSILSPEMCVSRDRCWAICGQNWRACMWVSRECGRCLRNTARITLSLNIVTARLMNREITLLNCSTTLSDWHERRFPHCRMAFMPSPIILMTMVLTPIRYRLRSPSRLITTN